MASFVDFLTLLIMLKLFYYVQRPNVASFVRWAAIALV